MIRTLLVANRGEIAVRVIRACRELGIRSIAVYSDADREALHVQLADAAIPIGAADPRQSYLDGTKLIGAAHAAGAQAIHPGYGFLAENAPFARAVAESGLIFVGPGPEVISRMGDKLGARRSMAELGIPIVPGSAPDSSAAALRSEASRVGFPLLVKAAGGGGGRGMRRVESAEELPAALAAAASEARAAFGDERVYLERALARPRHVEVQVLADRHGHTLHLFERECSLQRRFQKIIEEAPAPNLPAGLRAQLLDAAVQAASAVGYEGAGSVEFLVHGSDWYFLEMNTRLQVEHPVTEMICGVDLVRAQIEVAAGAPLPWRQDDLTVRGHAIEARVCAEDPARGFVPSPGAVELFAEPGGPGVRCDAGIATGTVIAPQYDSLIAKIVSHDATRPGALVRLERALTEMVVLGVTTNVGLLLDLLATPAVRSGELDTELIARHLEGPASAATPVAALAAAALALLAPRGAPTESRNGPAATPSRPGPWEALPGWRMGGDS